MIRPEVRQRRHSVVVALVVVGLIAAGCGGNDATVPTPEAGTVGVSGQGSEPTGAGELAATQESAEPAPPLGTIDSWHNSEPLTLEQLRGSPVLLVFWADL